VNQSGNIWAQLAPLAVIAVIMALRMRRINRPRRFNLGRVWLVPAVYTVLVGLILLSRPPVLLGWVLFAVSLAAGAALGWQRGRLTHLELAPEGGYLLARQSRAATMMIVMVLVLRVGARQLFIGDNADPAELMLVTDALLGFALGFLALQRIEMAIRARRLLAGSPG
jgi:hypothetical protein